MSPEAAKNITSMLTRSCPTVANSSASSGEDTKDSEVRRRPIPGKGFNKSRKGCYACKRRRVKCSETRPRCSSCQRLGLTCEYPPPRRLALVPALAEAPAPPITPVAFGFDDLRFFHHFTVAARPWLPYGLDNVWQAIASTATEHDFLVYAILGMAAQHLTAFTNIDYSLQAIRHRVRAIKALNDSLSNPSRTTLGGDARRAAIMILMFQAAYMPDGMMEFLSILRGWMIISQAVSPAIEDSLFKNFTRDAYVNSMRNRISGPDHISDSTRESLENFSASLRTLAPICRTATEVKYLTALERIAAVGRISPSRACLEIVPCFAMTNKLGDEEFTTFTNPQNHTAQVLLAHLFMLGWLLEKSTLGLDAEPFAFPRAIILSWVDKIAEKLPLVYKQYMVWPLGLARLSKSTLHK